MVLLLPGMGQRGAGTHLPASPRASVCVLVVEAVLMLKLPAASARCPAARRKAVDQETARTKMERRCICTVFTDSCTAACDVASGIFIVAGESDGREAGNPPGPESVISPERVHGTSENPCASAYRTNGSLLP